MENIMDRVHRKPPFHWDTFFDRDFEFEKKSSYPFYYTRELYAKMSNSYSTTFSDYPKIPASRDHYNYSFSAQTTLWGGSGIVLVPIMSYNWGMAFEME